MEITTQITRFKSVTRTCATTTYNAANGAVTNGISAFVQLILAQEFTNVNFNVVEELRSGIL